MMIRKFHSRFQVSALILAVAIPAILATTACSGRHGTAVQNDEGEPSKGPMLSLVKMNDPAAPAQLTKGFYGVESGAWRWTAGSFSVVLKTPAGAAQKGGALTFKLVVPDVVIKQVHTQTLTASIGGKPLTPATYSAAGNYAYAADIPATMLTGDSTTIDFTLDNSMPPSPADRRELGVIATAVDLESK